MVSDIFQYFQEISFAYRYVTGYGTDPAHDGNGTNFTVQLVKECMVPAGPAPGVMLYASEELVDYPIDSCDKYPDCYSPSIPVHAKVNYTSLKRVHDSRVAKMPI